MATLSKRATPAQAQLLIMVSGAVRNAATAHPDLGIPDWFARSVSKRAVGTLTAKRPDVLAAPRCARSCKRETALVSCSRGRRFDLPKPDERGPAQSGRRSPLPKMWKLISAMIAPMKARGENVEPLRDVLRAMDVAMKVGAAHG